ncbi:MAG: S41 family peptidase, partial [Acidimicrobiia bacterium]
MSTGYFRFPTVHGDRVAFVSEDDLWVVDRSGGTAARLTAGSGRTTAPRWSPDGAAIAYTASDEGDQDVWLMDADGGEPRRLTHLGGITSLLAWEPDGSAVWVSSNAREPFARLRGLYRVPIDGSGPVPEPRGNVLSIARRADGATVLGLHNGEPARWKRYRGGLAGRLWIDPAGDGEFRRYLHTLDGNVVNPIWVDGRVWFVSDHEGVGHLYSAGTTGRGLRRESGEDEFYVRTPDTDGDTVVWSAGADLFALDVASGEQGRIDVELPSSRPARRRRFQAPGKHLESVALHPEGHSLAVVARGGAFTMPLWEGTPRRHGPVSWARQRLATWMGDGERLVMVSDEGGTEHLVVAAPGDDEPTRHHLDLGRARTLAPAPSGDLVAVTNHRFELLVVDVAKGSVTEVHENRYRWIGGTSWSPDGRWLAFAAHDSELTSAIHVHDTKQGRTHRVTAPGLYDYAPAFDPKGRYLAFLSHREFMPVADLDFHDYGFPADGKPYLVTLRADLTAPFSPLRAEPRAPGAPAVEANGESKDGEVPEVEIDLDGIEGRVVATPAAAGVHGRVALTADKLLVSSYPIVKPPPSLPPTPVAATLQSIDLTTGQVEKVADGVRGFTLDAKAKVLALRVGEKLRVVPAGWKDPGDGKDQVSRETGWVDLGRISVEVRPGDEWQQMLHEAWRLQRDHFWDPELEGVDWEAVLARWEPLVDRVGARSEFSDLMWEMQGELGTSHAYEMGGDYTPLPKWQTGSLGAVLERGPRSGWRLGEIIRGDSWKPNVDSPLAAPGVDAEPGDRLLAVDGVPTDREVDPHALLVARAGKPVTLTLRRGRRRPHDVVVVPLSGEHALRYRAWVEGNRRRVAEASDGRLGYLHIPDMGPAGFAEFHRSFRQEVEKDGLVVDVRFNGGGNVSQILLERLRRERLGWRVTRWHGLRPFPYESPTGVMVALTNEQAGSDGDIFSHTWKIHGLGPLIGTRTWGGVIGIWPQQSLVDGTVTTQPEFGSWFVDVGYGVENYGTDPDIEVQIRPQDVAAGDDPQLERGIREALRLLSS